MIFAGAAAGCAAVSAAIFNVPWRSHRGSPEMISRWHSFGIPSVLAIGAAASVVWIRNISSLRAPQMAPF
eukprot:6275522-Alexandrium_andersonii.AAC.1